jgi:hypothetical protein
VETGLHAAVHVAHKEQHSYWAAMGGVESMGRLMPPRLIDWLVMVSVIPW